MNTPNSGWPARHRTLAAAALAACGVFAAGQALAQSEPAVPGMAQPAAAAPAPSEIMAVNLMRLLVKQGVITQAQADSVIQEAEAEAKQAQLASATGAAPPPPAPGVVRVPYVPEVVRNQIRDDIKKDVLAEAKSEGWASPNAVPSWVDRFHWIGDFRFRDEDDLYSQANDPQFIDYATFNASGPTDVNQITNANGVPLLNTRVNRLNQLSLRAHFGAQFDVADGVSLTVRLATGSDGSPVSTTQLLGGGLSKKDIWLDQAFLTLKPVDWGSISVGRMPNLFMHTNLMFDDNLNFDGVQAAVDAPVGVAGLRLFGAAAALPLDYVGANAPAGNDSTAKTGDHTKWLFAIQAGAKYQPDPAGWSLRGAVSYYDYVGTAGQFSAPCEPYAPVHQACSTDFSRPSFMQKGNTLFLLRDVVPPANDPNFQSTADSEFVGLLFDYRLLDATAEFEFPLFGDIRGQLTGDYVRNMAYEEKRAINNALVVTNKFNADPYRSGPNAFMIKGTVGYLHPENRGDWNFAFGYKYIQPDALLDAFTDHDFHLGGTNAKGYFLSGAYYFAHNTWADVRWFSADEVYGAPLSIDVLQLELNTRF